MSWSWLYSYWRVAVGVVVRVVPVVVLVGVVVLVVPVVVLVVLVVPVVPVVPVVGGPGCRKEVMISTGRQPPPPREIPTGRSVGSDIKIRVWVISDRSLPLPPPLVNPPVADGDGDGDGDGEDDDDDSFPAAGKVSWQIAKAPNNPHAADVGTRHRT